MPTQTKAALTAGLIGPVLFVLTFTVDGWLILPEQDFGEALTAQAPAARRAATRTGLSGASAHAISK
jgi:hypothetical protein